MPRRISRREAMKIAGAGLAAASCPRLARADGKRARPNILWISCEDIGPHLGCYGDPAARTPTLDRLAREGVRYTRAFTTYGVCAPSRSSIIMGMYPTTLGTQPMRCRASIPDRFQPFPVYLRAAGYHCTNQGKTDYQASIKGGWQGRHWRQRPPDRPFFAVFNFTCTHESQVLTGGPAVGEDFAPDPDRRAGKLDLPAYYADTPIARANWARYHQRIAELDRQVARLLKDLDDDGLTARTIVFFWSDHGAGLPRAKRWPYDSGTHVPLIVRIPEAFASLRPAEPGKTCDELVGLVDLAPTMLNLAGAEVPEHMQGRAFLGANRTRPREYVYSARDRMDERYDIVRSVRDRRYRYVRNFEPFKPYYQRVQYAERAMMQELRQLHARGKLPPAAGRFMASTRPAEELYDTEADPHEVRNLAGAPEHRATLQRLRGACEAWMLRCRDLGLMPEAEMAQEEERLGSRWAILRRPGRERLLPALLEIAAVAGRPEDADRARLVEALKHREAAVRYWGAIGLGNLAARAAPAEAALAAATRDASASVRVAAARGMWKLGRTPAALDVLVAILGGDAHGYARLAAAGVLDEMGEDARPALGAIRRAAKARPDRGRAGRVARRYIDRVLKPVLGRLDGE